MRSLLTKAGRAQLTDDNAVILVEYTRLRQESNREQGGGIPASATSIPAGHVPAGAVVGRNSTGSVGYAGVCPPAGKSHSIVFLLYALRTKVNVSSGFDPRTVQRQLSGNTIAAGLMFGTYKRP